MTARPLRQRAAAITGASSGIGRAIALALAAEGAAVCLIGRDRDRLAACDAAARERGARRASVLSGDLADVQAVRRIAAALLDQFAELDVLVHCAGMHERGPVAAAPAEALDRQYAANLRAPYLLTQLLLPRLRERQGDIVFINSSKGLESGPEVTQFAATQHGLKAVADGLREEVNADGVRVLSMHLGRTATPRQEHIFAEDGLAYAPERLLQPEDVATVVVTALGLPRTAEVTSVTMRPAIKSY